MDKSLSGRQYTTVLADDVPELRRLLRHVLSMSDRFEVLDEAENGAEAVTLAERHKPDLMLLDISMPVMDGMEALPKILGVSPDTRVVVLSGFEAERMGPAALEAGAAAYVEKGVPPSVLIARLLEILGDEGPSGGSPPAVAPPIAAEASISDVSAEEMMSLVAHEIRNPLAVIQGFGTELQNRWDTMAEDKRLDAVRRMTERARYLNTVVNNLMFMRRLQSGQTWTDPAPISLGDLLRGSWDELNDLSRGHPVVVEIPDEVPLIKAESARLRQVLTNLVVNAAKFAPGGTPITIRSSSSNDRVFIHVSDEGPGIPQDARETIFGKFSRLQEGGSGIGLGLFICRALMQSMRGDIYVADSPVGATFCLELPAAGTAT